MLRYLKQAALAVLLGAVVVSGAQAADRSPKQETSLIKVVVE